MEAAWKEVPGLPRKMTVHTGGKKNLKECSAHRSQGQPTPRTPPFAPALGSPKRHMTAKPLINRLLQLRLLTVLRNPLQETASVAMLAKF